MTGHGARRRTRSVGAVPPREHQKVDADQAALEVERALKEFAVEQDDEEEEDDLEDESPEEDDDDDGAAWEGPRDTKQELLDAEHHLLQTQLQTAETEIGAMRDELYFAERRLEEAKQQIESLQKDLAAERLRKAGAQEVQQSIGVMKFQHQKDLLVQRRLMQKRYCGRIRKAHDQLATQECRLMFLEDAFLSPPPVTIQPSPAGVCKEVEYAVSDKSGSHHFLEPSKTNTASVDDEYIDLKVKQSDFADPLRALKESLHPVLRDFKDSSDKSLLTLERILWPPVGRHPRPKEAFQRAAKAQLVRSQVLLADGIRRMNNTIQLFIAGEKEVKAKWTEAFEAARRGVDEECQVDIPPPKSEEEIKLEHELKMVKEHVNGLRAKTAEKERLLKWDRDRVRLNLQFIQQKTIDLHRQLYSALHKVFKHRYKWIDRHPDPLRTFLQKKASKRPVTDVEYNLGLGEVLQKDTAVLCRFGEYFTRDDLFGVDMTAKDAAGKAEPTVPAVPWRAVGSGTSSSGPPVHKERSASIGTRRSSMSSIRRPSDASSKLVDKMEKHDKKQPVLRALVHEDSLNSVKAAATRRRSSLVPGLEGPSPSPPDDWDINEGTFTLPAVSDGSSAKKQRGKHDSSVTVQEPSPPARPPSAQSQRRGSTDSQGTNDSLQGTKPCSRDKGSSNGESVANGSSADAVGSSKPSVPKLDLRSGTASPPSPRRGSLSHPHSPVHSAPHPPAARSESVSPRPVQAGVRPPRAEPVQRAARGSLPARTARPLAVQPQKSDSQLHSALTQQSLTTAKPAGGSRPESKLPLSDEVASLLTYPVKHTGGWCSPPRNLHNIHNQH